MGKPDGFLTTPRKNPTRRPVALRLLDWNEVYEPQSEDEVREQAGRCMDCGIPFCHQGCPLGNLIPEWNDLVYRGRFPSAIERLHATNNFPEFTGRLCPAPCESACVVAISAEPVSIERTEYEIAERAWSNELIQPLLPAFTTGKSVAIVGSGPAGLAAAQQLRRAGHDVTVFERNDAIGGLLRFGIPEFKMEKHHIDRRLEQMTAEGVKFRTGIEIGIDRSATDLLNSYDAVVLAVGATAWRDLDVPGRELAGIYQAMEYLPESNRVQLGDLDSSAIDVAGRDVVIIGGGDTGADCLGTAIRQKAASVTQLDIMPRPSEERPSAQPWPTYPIIYRVSSAHEELDNRVFSVNTQEFVGDGNGNLKALKIVEVKFENGKFEPVAGSEREIPADFVFMAMGFIGPEKSSLLSQLEVELDERGNIKRDANFQTNQEGIFVAGDAGRGQSLIVWAIAEGRSAAAAVDTYLSASGTTQLPAPIEPTARPLTV